MWTLPSPIPYWSQSVLKCSNITENISWMLSLHVSPFGWQLLPLATTRFGTYYPKLGHLGRVTVLSWRNWRGYSRRPLSLSRALLPQSRALEPLVRGTLPLPGGRKHPCFHRNRDTEKFPKFITMRSRSFCPITSLHDCTLLIKECILFSC